MIIYNVTIKPELSIAEAWISWLQTEHIADVMATGCFVSAKVLKLLEVDETDGPTYAIQYEAESKAMYNRYIEKFAGEMRDRSFRQWGNKFIAFRSVMQVVN